MCCIINDTCSVVAQLHNIYKNKELHCIALATKKRKSECSHVYHNQLDDPLPFKIMYTNIYIGFHTGGGLHGQSPVFFLF